VDTDTHDRLHFEFDRRTEPRVSYMVCSIPRSGSSLLCELLAATGLAGAPAEFFHPDKMALLERRWGVDTLADYLRELLARKTSPNGVFGTKAHWGQYKPLFGDSNPGEIMPNPRVVLITRRDRLRQAVSWVRALQTLKWTNTDGPRVERPAVYDHEQISQKLGRIDREEESWESLCERHGLVPHRVVYEDFVEAQEQTVRAVLDRLGIEAPADLHLPPPVLDRQADEQSEQWVERYLAEAASA
jgi:trehalose 2-sulfotransferase